MLSADEIRDLLCLFLAEEVECEPVSKDERIGCLTPLAYPIGDGVVVWVEPRADGYCVSDYGEAFAETHGRPAQDHGAIVEMAARISRLHGVAFKDDQLTIHAEGKDLGEAVWRVASAAAEVSHAAAAFRPKRRSPAREFAQEVQRDLSNRDLEVETERKLTGQSGHAHTASIYLPAREAIIEPVRAAGNWNQVSAVYAKFGDLTRANGFKPFALIDDREHEPSPDIANMLTQVGDVIEWSRRDEWSALLTADA